MRAIRIHETGGPEVLQLDEVERRRRRARARRRLRHHAIGVNFIDIYHRTGFYPTPTCRSRRAAKARAKSSRSGRPSRASRPATASPMSGRPAPTPRSATSTRNSSSSCRERSPTRPAAAMMLKGLTAQYLLRQTYRVKEGDTILVHAAAGGVGQILCQWGKALGATVIGTVGSPEKAKIAKKAGAKHVDPLPRGGFRRARRARSPRARNATSSTTASARRPFPASLDCLKPFGMFASFGSASGAVEAFNLGLLAQKGSLFATRPTLFTFLADRARLESMARDLFRAVGSGEVKIRIGKRCPLAEAAQAHAALEARETTGSTVLMP